MSIGEKRDAGKLRWSLLPFDALREVVRVLMKGAEKYAPGNWQYVECARDRYFDAAMRHLSAWYEGERNDPEWGLHHLAHCCCCVLFLLALSLRGKIDAEKDAAQVPRDLSPGAKGVAEGHAPTREAAQLAAESARSSTRRKRCKTG